MTRTPVGGLALIALLASTSAMAQTDSRPKPQQVPAVKPADPLASVPSLSGLVARTTSEMAGVLERFTADQQSLNRRYDAPDSPEQRTRFRAFYGAWRARLKEVDFEKLKQEGRVDYVLLDHYLQHQQALLDRADKQRTETAPLLPFADALLTLQDTRRTMASVDGKAAAHTLAQITKEVDSLRTLLDAPAGRGGAQGGAADAPRAAAPKASRTIANRAADNLDQIRSTITGWYRYYDGYDPLFSWWAKDPYTKLDDALTRYSRSIRDRLVGGAAAAGSQIAAGGGRGAAPATGGGGRGGGAGGAGGGGGGGRGGTDNSGPIIGDPIGMDGLMADLQYEMIPYTPDELIAIAEKEYAFSLSEMKKASREMGFGDDWKKAMDKVKDTYVDPGKQPDLIRDLGRQAEEFFDAHDWVTIPALAKEDWRMEMMTPDRQRVAPFFLGGEMIQVSYPTADMTDDEKLMSLRGNNPHFSHATVFHELNPGHHLQQFMQARYNQQRRIFTTPFWSEGQSLYWEMFLWDHGFQVSPEDRVGALFWRMHRSARIIFSLNFHLGKMTPDQAIQFLVDTVNFERANAEGEVRRSFNGTYSPLYQAGYMLGGLEIRALHKELVDGKKMTDREFHDAILQGGPMPIAMVRARLANTPLTRDGPGPWKFADLLPPPIPAPIKR